MKMRMANKAFHEPHLAPGRGKLRQTIDAILGFETWWEESKGALLPGQSVKLRHYLRGGRKGEFRCLAYHFESTAKAGKQGENAPMNLVVYVHLCAIAIILACALSLVW